VSDAILTRTSSFATGDTMPDSPRDRNAATPAGDQMAESMPTSPGGAYPMNQVVGVLDTEPQLVAAVKALTGGGFLASEINVATGPAAADHLRATTGREGLADLVIRVAEALGAMHEEMRVKARYEAALRANHFVIGVLAPTDERKRLAARMLREHGAHDVNYMSRFTIERLVPPRAD
jgi:hypothetical protein